MRNLLCLLIAAVSAGCVTLTEPVQMGKDTYMLTTHARGGFNSDGALMTQAIAKAGDFCASKGLQVFVQSKQQKGVQGWTPQDNQIIFLCLKENDPRYQSPNYRPAPDLVIENRKE
jgi:hypothetical protein